MTWNENGAADSDESRGGNVSRDELMHEASALWSLAADQCRWGLVFDAAETRRLALGKRVEAILADALHRADVAREARS